jgi:hypothetical protein
MASSTNITNGIKAIKIAKVDAFGNNNTLSLQELDTLVIEFSDLGRVNFTVTSIAEYPSYYLYYVIVKEIGYQNSIFIEPSLLGPGGSGFIATGSIHVAPYSSGPTGYLGSFSIPNNLSPYSYNNSTGVFTSPSWSVAYTDVVNFTCSIYTSQADGSASLYTAITSSTGTAGILGSVVIKANNCFGIGNAKTISGSIPFRVTAGNNVNFGLILGNYYGSGFLVIPTSTVIMNLVSYVTSSTDVNGDLTVLEPYLSEDFVLSDYNVLAGNAVIAREDVFFMDVDFATNQIQAVNQNAILNGSAAKAPVQYSNYTSARQINSRYVGKELTSAKLNEWTQGDISYGKTPNVSNPEVNFVYFNYAGGTSPEWGNQNADRTQINIRYIVDQNGNVTKPINDSDGINLGTIQQTFEENLGATLVLDDNDTFGVNLAALNGSWPIFKSGYKITPIIYTQTASYDNNGNVIGYGYTSSILFNQGEQGPDVTKNNYMMYAAGVDDSVILTDNTVQTVQFSQPVFSGSFANFNTVTSSYKPTGSLAQLSASGYILDFKAYIEMKENVNAVVTYALQRSTNNGGNWFTIGNTRQVNYNNTRTGQIFYREVAATTSTLYRIAAVNSSAGSGVETLNLSNTSYLHVTQYPNPGIGTCTNITAPFWTTGSSANILLASTASDGLNNYYSQRQENIERSGFNPIVEDFELKTNDEIRFEGLENLAFVINNVTSSATGQLILNLDRNIPNGTNLNFFLVRRYIEDPSSIILEVNKPAGASSGGVLKPQYISSDLTNNLDSIIQNLKNQNLI